MGYVVSKGRCYTCGSLSKKLYKTFGKFICSKCLAERRTGRKGNSGMVYDENTREEDYYDESLADYFLFLKPVKKSHKLFVKWFIEHYPKSKGIVGRSINFLIYQYGKPIGIIGFASPPLSYKKVEKFFGISHLPLNQRGRIILNNNVFRIVYTQRNIGTQILKLARQEVRRIYKEKYGDDLIGLITFVEPPRTGALYEADNWTYLGMTEGIEVKRRGETWFERKFINGNKKHIFAYKYKDVKYGKDIPLQRCLFEVV